VQLWDGRRIGLWALWGYNRVISTRLSYEVKKQMAVGVSSAQCIE